MHFSLLRWHYLPAIAIACVVLGAAAALPASLFQEDASTGIAALLVESERWQTLGNLDAAAKCAMAALAELESYPDPRLSSIALTQLTWIALDRGRLPEAQDLARKALATVVELSGSHSAEYAIAAGNLASVLIQEAKYIQADRLTLEALNTARIALGVNTGKYADLLSVRAQLYSRQRKNRQAIGLLEEELRVRRSLGSNPEQLGQTYQNLAVVYQSVGKLPLALAAVQKAEDLWRGSLPSNSQSNQSRLFASNTRLAIYDSMRQYERAGALIETLLPRAEDLLGAGHPALVVILDNIGSVYQHQKRYTDAAAVFERAYNISVSTLGPFHPDTALALLNYGTALRELGQSAKGRDLERQARLALGLVH